jgi:hypothetical protein
MADETQGASVANGFTIQVKDGVAPSIAPNLAEIGKQARSAQNSLQAFKAILAALDNSGVSGLRNVVSGLATSVTTLSNAQNKSTTSAQALSTVNLKLANSYQTLNFAVQATLVTMTSYAPVAITARNASAGFSTAANNASRAVGSVGTAGHGSVTGVQAASAAIRGLEGNFGSSVRAGERFLVTTLRMGPILQAAFPIFGALAMLGIIDILTTHIGNVVAAYKAMGEAAVKAEFDAIAAGDKIVKAQRESFFSADHTARLIAGAGAAPESIDIINVQTKLRDLARERAEFSATIRANEAGLQGEAQQKQRTADLKVEQEFLIKQRDTIKEIASGLKVQGEAFKKVTAPVDDRTAALVLQGKLAAPTTGLSTLDAKQRKSVEDQFRVATEGVKDLDSQINILGSDIRASEAKEPLKGLVDNAKAARLQLKLFQDQLGQLKTNKGSVITPQDELALLQKQRATALPANVPELDSRIGVATQAIERQKAAVEQLSERYRDQVDAIGLYSDAQKIAHAQSKIDIELEKLLIDTHSAKALAIKADAATVIQNAEYEKQLNRIYGETVSPLKTYMEGVRAANKLEADGVITHIQASQEVSKLSRAYTDALNPLAEYSRTLQNQFDLFGKYGVELTVVTELQRVQEQLRQQGKALSADEINKLTTILTQMDRQKAIQSQVNNLFDQHIGQMEKLTVTYAAITEARKKGIITQQQEAIELSKLKVSLSELQIALGKATGKDILTATFGDYIRSFKSFEQSTTQIFQHTFSTIADGAADAFGRAIAYGEDLGDALKNVARQALAELISSFIKLGIQMVIQHIIGTTLGATAAATSIAEGAAVATAWAPAAAFVSLATFGANAVPASVGIASTTALADLLAIFHPFNAGGIVPGAGSTDTVPTMLTPGEAILTKRATQNIGGASTIQALNSGARFVQGGSTVGSGIKVEIIQHPGVAIAVEQSEGKMRIIAKQEAQDAVERHAPNVIAGAIQNSNSSVSKSIQNHTTARRKR